MHMPIERTEPSDLKVHFCQDLPPQSQISSGEPSLALRALTLTHRFEAWLCSVCAEPTAVFATWPPDDPFDAVLDEPLPDVDLPWEPFPESPGLALGVPLEPGLAPAEGEAGGPVLTGGDTGGTPPGQIGAGAPGFFAAGPWRWFAAFDAEP
jgi:hypothetical protein